MTKTQLVAISLTLAISFPTTEAMAQQASQSHDGTVHVTTGRGSDDILIVGGRRKGELLIDFLNNGSGWDEYFMSVSGLDVQTGDGFDNIEIEDVQIDSLTIDSGSSRQSYASYDYIQIRDAEIAGAITIDAAGTESGDIAMTRVSADQIVVGESDLPRFFNMYQVSANELHANFSGEDRTPQTYPHNYLSASQCDFGSLSTVGTSTTRSLIRLYATDAVDMNFVAGPGPIDVDINNALTETITVSGSLEDDRVAMNRVQANVVDIRIGSSTGSTIIGDLVVIDNSHFGEFSMLDGKREVGVSSFIRLETVEIDRDCTISLNDDLVSIYLNYVEIGAQTRGALSVLNLGDHCRLDRAYGFAYRVNYAAYGSNDIYAYFRNTSVIDSIVQIENVWNY